MKIELKDGPTISSPPNTSAKVAREAAIAKLLGNQSPTPANPNPGIPTSLNSNSLSPEDTTSVNSQASEGQINTNESASPVQEAKPADNEAKSAKEEQPLSRQYAVLARKEKELRVKVQGLSAKEEALKAREAAISAKEAEYQDGSKFISKDRISQDPWNTLQSLGISYDQLTQLALNPPAQLDPTTKAMLDQIRAEASEAKKAMEEMKRNQQDEQTRQYQQAVEQIRSETKSLVKSSPELYATISETNSVDDVVDLIERTFKEENRLMTVEEAASAVEDYLVEEAVKLAKIKKIQQKLTPPAPKAESAAANPQLEKKPGQPETKTLTNSLTSSRPLSQRERAIAAFQGKLK